MSACGEDGRPVSGYRRKAALAEAGRKKWRSLLISAPVVQIADKQGSAYGLYGSSGPQGASGVQGSGQPTGRTIDLPRTEHLAGGPTQMQQFQQPSDARMLGEGARRMTEGLARVPYHVGRGMGQINRSGENTLRRFGRGLQDFVGGFASSGASPDQPRSLTIPPVTGGFGMAAGGRAAEGFRDGRQGR